MTEHYVADLEDLKAAGRKIVRVDNTDVALLYFADQVLAFENVCAHMGGPVGEGMIIEKVVSELDDQGRVIKDNFKEDEPHLVCPWHGWEYKLPSLQCAAAPERKLRSFPVALDGDRIMVQVPSTVQ